MSSSQMAWHDKLGSAFLQARELDGRERAEFLRSLSATDSEMADWVVRMLDAEQKSAPILEGAARGKLSRFSIPGIEGARIGSYTITRRIGAGGMGAVYEAEQDRPRRSVAIKILPAGFGSAAAARRFEYESEVLARLRHPSIAQIYEAGVHVEGNLNVPFFAMEFVAQARPITAYAREVVLDARQIANLFIRVCDAVHHGHLRGVIHRDLKPDNILVDASGQPKVIDFGVARAVDRNEMAVSQQTQAGQLIGTVPYMSPEQLGGLTLDLDARTDVYSLGVVLFELLTGRLPHDVTKKTIVEAVRMIRETPPARAAALKPAIPSDLDRILMRSLARDRDGRYASAADLGADLTRFLNDEPISARPPSVVYQFKKFAKRNRPLVAASVLVLLTLIGGIVAERMRANEAFAATIRANEAAKEATESRERAQVQLARADEIVHFLNNMLLSVTPDEANGRAVTVQQVLDAVSHDIESESKHTPEVEATIRLTIGRTYYHQGLYREAKAMLAKAVETLDGLGAQTEEAADALDFLGRTLLNLKEIQASLDAFDKALAIAAALSGPQSDLALRIQTDRGESLYKLARFPEVVQTLRQIDAIRVHRDGEKNSAVQANRSNLAMVLKQMGEYDEAKSLLESALNWHRENEGEVTTQTLELRQAIASLEFSRGNFEGSNQISSALMEDFRRHFGPDHALTGRALFEYATRLAGSGGYNDAEARFREALAIQEKVFGPDHVEVAHTMSRLASTVSAQGRIDEALEIEGHALEVYRATPETDPVEHAWALHEYANTLLRANRCDDARQASHDAVARLRDVFGDDSNQTLTGRHLQALIESKCGDIDLGIELTKAVLADRLRLLPPGHPDTTLSYLNLGRACRDAGRLEEAIDALTHSVELSAARGETADDLRIGALGDLTLLYQVLNRNDEAERAAREMVAWYEVHESEMNTDRGYAYCALANGLMTRGNAIDADRLISADIRSLKLPPDLDGRIAGVILLARGRLLQIQGRTEEASLLKTASIERFEQKWNATHPVTQWAREAR